LLTVATANAGDAVYGAVMIGVLLAAEDARHVGYLATIEAAGIVLALYLLMHLYTYMLGLRLRSGETLNARLFWRGCVHELPILEGAVIPVAALLVAWAAGLAVTSGVSAALWTTVGVVVVLEVAAGWRSREQGVLWLQALAGMGMGLALIGLKLLLH
jgi:hypothetical protein